MRGCPRFPSRLQQQTQPSSRAPAQTLSKSLRREECSYTSGAASTSASPQQFTRWDELAEMELPALPAVAEHPMGAALTTRALAPHITARAGWMTGIDAGAGHGHGTVSGASQPLAAATKLSLACCDKSVRFSSCLLLVCFSSQL